MTDAATVEESTSSSPTLQTKIVAEFLGTFLLVFGGVGTALFAANFGTSPNGTSLGVGFLGVALAFGLTVLVGVYAWGPISGGHFNPAVTVGVASAGRMPWAEVPAYLIAQVVGGAAASTVLFLIGRSGPQGWLETARADGFASNGFAEHSPGGFGFGGAVTIEVVLTAVFVLVILGATHATRGSAFAGVAIGLSLTLIHLISIPVTNTSVNPARSIAAAIYSQSGSLAQVWAFIVFPIVGAILAAIIYRSVFEGEKSGK
ncbi:MAG TPA: aquaporin Z [Beutenbergiaceae bacterium]|nr:aquaporin Z [Beutenbergiaceae bacterium]